ncbi:uncharacterized protein METZ01_LOCUS236916, partial [marine metagenome]
HGSRLWPARVAGHCGSSHANTTRSRIFLCTSPRLKRIF